MEFAVTLVSKCAWYLYYFLLLQNHVRVIPKTRFHLVSILLSGAACYSSRRVYYLFKKEIEFVGIFLMRCLCWIHIGYKCVCTIIL